MRSRSDLISSHRFRVHARSSARRSSQRSRAAYASCGPRVGEHGGDRQIAICASRLGILIVARNRAIAHQHAPTDLNLFARFERQRRLGECDLPALLGGDEFVVLAEGRTAEEATEFGQRLVDAIDAPYDLGPGTSARIGVSVGIAIAPQHRSKAADLLRAADAALYQAKFDGGSRSRPCTETTWQG